MSTEKQKIEIEGGNLVSARIDLSKIVLAEDTDLNELEPQKIKLLSEILEKDPDEIRPILVREKEDGEYEILTDARMLYALKDLGHQEGECVVISSDQDFSIDSASPKDLLTISGLGCLIKRERFIELDLVSLPENYQKNMLDGEKSREMGRDIIKNGQSNPITLGVIIVDGEVHYEITDGFHRTSVFKELDFRTCRAVKVYGWDMGEIYHQRILAASSARSVVFVRLTSWSQDWFKETPWFKKGLSLPSVLGLAANNSSGRNLGLTREEAEAAKAWAHKLVSAFDPTTKMGIGIILRIMRAVEQSFPEVVEQVRTTSGGGHVGEGKGVFNQAKFLSLVEVLPNDYERQMFVLKLNSRHNLNSAQIAEVGSFLKNVDLDSDTEILKGLKLDPLSVISEAYNNADVDETTIEDSSGTLVVLDVDTRVDDRKPKKGRGSRSHYIFSDPKPYDSVTPKGKELKPEEYQAIIDSLQDALTKSRKLGNTVEVEWMTMEEITPVERAILNDWIINAVEPDEIAGKYSIDEYDVYRFIRSAFRKIHLKRLAMKDAATVKKFKKDKKY